MAKRQRNLESLHKCKGYGALTSTMYLQPFCKNKAVYKYMDLETAIICLSSGTIRFSEPTLWPDKYEGRFYTADYTNVCTDKSCTPKLYACCFTCNKTSEAAWSIYSRGKTGIGNRCVQFQIDIAQLRKALNAYCKEQKATLYEARIDYRISEEIINGIHRSSSPYYQIFFKNFTLNSYLSLLSIKRSAFYDENELRYFIVPNDQNLHQKLDISLSWKELIKAIYIDDKMSDIEKKILRSYCQEAGLTIVKLSENGVHIQTTNLYKEKMNKVKIEKLHVK